MEHTRGWEKKSGNKNGSVRDHHKSFPSKTTIGCLLRTKPFQGDASGCLRPCFKVHFWNFVSFVREHKITWAVVGVAVSKTRNKNVTKGVSINNTLVFSYSVLDSKLAPGLGSNDDSATLVDPLVVSCLV